MSSIRLQKHILERLLRKRVIGSHWLKIDTVLSGVRSDEIGELRGAIKDLLKRDFLVWYDRGREAIQLNKYLLKEIRAFLETDENTEEAK